MTVTIEALLTQAEPAAPAIAGFGRTTMSHAGLAALTERTRAALAAAGIGGGARVATVLPNGPAAASAFVAIAQCATVAPLNQAYRADEFDFYLSDLGAKAVVVPDGLDGPAVEVARRKGCVVLRLAEDPAGPAGDFTLRVDGRAGQPVEPHRPGAGDVALILHTSGTTSRPKIVPLTQANLAASAGHIVQTLALTRADRCLVVMPLFHIHGLIAATLSSLSAGGSLIVPDGGFDGLKFFRQLEESEASWMTAVPTMYQAILARSERNREVIARAGLRLLRSSSASLPPQVMLELEAAFGCPVIESYGMTEAAHQMTSNPLPPAERRPGSVGIAAGPQVRVCAPDGTMLAPGEEGEVVISGPNVTPGYEANPGANADAFFEAVGRRWFRTGDQGRMDAEGYLRITGRLKEIINRGGEKVSPLEVDEVVMDHPAVRQCVTFAIPHPKLGEEVAVAVVLREGQEAGEQQIRDFAAQRLAPFKVPRRVVILAEIPKGATGKLQRIGLAAKLGLG
ncbi:AMP-binding protein [Geminicoccus roseus]|uniref:AMP-binding protein n=1 Tax=Geminicoccus roseus TaxID=404900 RepID=UPI000403615A|nr:AMP-binding protein [Geminicoccus roseus]